MRQEYIAQRLGIDRTTYVRKERGAIPITTEEWLKISDAMEEDPSCFFSGGHRLNNKPGKKRVEKREANLVKLFRALNREEREELVSCLHLMLKGIRRKPVKDALSTLLNA